MTDTKIIQAAKLAGEQDARYLSAVLPEKLTTNGAAAALLEALAGTVQLAAHGREDEAMARLKSFTRHFGKELAATYNEVSHG